MQVQKFVICYIRSEQCFFQILAKAIKSLTWTYVSTLSDDSLISQAEHDAFRKLADDNGICVRNSQTIKDFETETVGNVATPGLVAFLSNLDDAKHLNKTAEDVTIILLTHDRPADAIQSLQASEALSKALIISDNPGSLIQSDNAFAVYLEGYLNSSLANDNIVIVNNLFESHYNCTNNVNDSTITCNDLANLQHRMFRNVGIFRSHIFTDVINMLSQISIAMENDNCTSFSKECLDDTMVETASEFKSDFNNTLQRKGPWSLEVNAVENGQVNKVCNGVLLFLSRMDIV